MCYALRIGAVSIWVPVPVYYSVMRNAFNWETVRANYKLNSRRLALKTSTLLGKSNSQGRTFQLIIVPGKKEYYVLKQSDFGLQGTRTYGYRFLVTDWLGERNSFALMALWLFSVLYSQATLLIVLALLKGFHPRVSIILDKLASLRSINIHNKSSWGSLNHFQLVNILLCVRVPPYWCAFHRGRTRD